MRRRIEQIRIPTDTDKKENKTLQDPFSVLSAFKPQPVLRDDEGNLNPRYRTGKIKNVLAGLNIAQGKMTGNPIYDFGINIGAVIGSLLGSNIAGRQQYMQDVQEVEQYNKNLEFQTQASLRAMQLAEMKANNEVRRAIQIENANNRALLAEAKVSKNKIEKLTNLVPMLAQAASRYPDNPEFEKSLREGQRALAEALGHPDPDNLPVDFGVGKSEQKVFGDIVYNISPLGDISYATIDGKILTNLKASDVEKHFAKGGVSPDIAKKAYEMAVNHIEHVEKNGMKFEKTTRHGKIPDNVQRNAAIMMVAKEFAEYLKKGTYPTTIEVNGKVTTVQPITGYTLNLSPPDMDSDINSNKSQFMPDIDDANRPIFDATQEGKKALYPNPNVPAQTIKSIQNVKEEEKQFSDDVIRYTPTDQRTQEYLLIISDLNKRPFLSIPESDKDIVQKYSIKKDIPLRFQNIKNILEKEGGNENIITDTDVENNLKLYLERTKRPNKTATLMEEIFTAAREDFRRNNKRLEDISLVKFPTEDGTMKWAAVTFVPVVPQGRNFVIGYPVIIGFLKDLVDKTPDDAKK